MRKLSLFSGILGDDLASEWAGIKTVCCVEIDPFCQAVIKKYYPDMPIIGDIHDVTKAKLKEVSGYEWVDIIAGGDPCQPRSIAGKRRGREDDRDLWEDMFRVICELKPAWVVNENPTGRLTMDFHEVLSDLESQGYETRSFVIPACAVNAPHRRGRVYIVAYSDIARIRTSTSRINGNRQAVDKGQNGFSQFMFGGQSKVAANSQQSRTWDTSGEVADQRRGASQDRREGIRQGNGEIGAGGLDTANQYGIIADPENTNRRRATGEENPWRGAEKTGRCHGDAADSRLQRPPKSKQQTVGVKERDGITPDSNECQRQPRSAQSGKRQTQRCNQVIADSHAEGLQGFGEPGKRAGELIAAADAWRASWIEVATALCGMDDGVSHRVARLKALGNAQVPQQVYPIYKAIVKVEEWLKESKDDSPTANPQPEV